MKPFFLAVSLICLYQFSFSQTVIDYKIKNKANEKDRTAMLDLLRDALQKEYKQTFIFVVNHFKVRGDYAWVMADAQRKDGKEIQLDENYDCCHVESLFKKKNGKWTILDYAGFSTDVWYYKIWERYEGVPQSIFPSEPE